MSRFAYALLDLRRIVHVAMAITVIAMVHTYGSPSARAQVDHYVVTPVIHVTETVGRHLGSSAEIVRSATKYLGWS